MKRDTPIIALHLTNINEEISSITLIQNSPN